MYVGMVEDDAEIAGAFQDYFTKLFQSITPTNVDIERSASLIKSKVANEMNVHMMRRYTKEEAYEALLQMGPLKSSRADGFGASFYQKHWHTIGEDVNKTVFCILHGAGMSQSFNSTFIALILKKCSSLSILILDQ